MKSIVSETENRISYKNFQSQYNNSEIKENDINNTCKKEENKSILLLEKNEGLIIYNEGLINKNIPTNFLEKKDFEEKNNCKFLSCFCK